MGARTLAVLLLSLPVGSCANSTGPRSVPADRLNYNEVISLSAKQQLLLNLVRARYLEAPSFVDISSMIDQFGREGQVNATLGLGTGLPDGGETGTVGALGRWSDKPTITYTPVTGRKFAQSLLTPLTPESLFALVQAGWPVDGLLGMTVRSVNGIRNETASPANRTSADPEFWELLAVWRRLRDKGALSLRLDEREGKRNIVVFSQPRNADPEVRADLKRIEEILNLSGDGEYTLRYGLAPMGPDEIAILSRSTLEIMINLAWFFPAPREHVEQGRTMPAFRASSDSRGWTIRVKHACERPACPYVAVKNRGYWFYVEDSDMMSKRAFMILEMMMTLTDSDDQARGPIVSIGG